MTKFEELTNFIKNIYDKGLDIYLNKIKLYQICQLFQADPDYNIEGPDAYISLCKEIFEELDGEVIKENNVPVKIKFNKLLSETSDKIHKIIEELLNDDKAGEFIKEILGGIYFEYKCKVMISDIAWDKDDKNLPGIIIAEIPIKPKHIFTETRIEEDALSYMRWKYKAKTLGIPSIKKVRNIIIHIGNSIGYL